MESGQKAIMIGVGVFIVILIISIVLLIVNLGLGSAERSLAKSGQIIKGLENQLIRQYDRKTLTGHDVAFAIEQYTKELNYNIVLLFRLPWGGNYLSSTLRNN